LVDQVGHSAFAAREVNVFWVTGGFAREWSSWSCEPPKSSASISIFGNCCRSDNSLAFQIRCLICSETTHHVCTFPSCFRRTIDGWRNGRGYCCVEYGRSFWAHSFYKLSIRTNTAVLLILCRERSGAVQESAIDLYSRISADPSMLLRQALRKLDGRVTVSGDGHKAPQTHGDIILIVFISIICPCRALIEFRQFMMYLKPDCISGLSIQQRCNSRENYPR
jgi:hypothetical protein